MHDTILLRAAVLALIPVGFSIGICFFVFAYLYLQSIRGKDVSRSIRRVRLLILVLLRYSSASSPLSDGHRADKKERKGKNPIINDRVFFFYKPLD